MYHQYGTPDESNSIIFSSGSEIRNYLARPGEISECLSYAYSGVYLSLTSRNPLDATVFERDWNVLIARLEVTRNYDHPFADVSDKASHSTTVQGPSYVIDRAIFACREPSEHRRTPLSTTALLHTESRQTRDQDDRRRGQPTKQASGDRQSEKISATLPGWFAVSSRFSRNGVPERRRHSHTHTADHGEPGQSGYFQRILQPVLKRVPRVETTATDERETRTMCRLVVVL